MRILLLGVFFLSSCSVYKSVGRKNFESQAPTQIAGISLMGCSPMEKILGWENRDSFERPHSSMENSRELEIFWTPGGREVQAWTEVPDQVHLRTFFPEKNQSLSCLYVTSTSQWEKSQSVFLEQLDFYMDTAEEPEGPGFQSN